MGLRVHANVVSTHARQVRVEQRQGQGFRRLSAGLRFSTGADAFAERLRAQIRSIENVQHDADDSACLVQAAEDALDEVSSLLSSRRELTTRPSTARARDPDRRGRLAGSNRVLDIDTAIHTLLITDENHSTAESRIRDVAVACETARRTRDSILRQASAALSAQANALPRSAQRLLG